MKSIINWLLVLGAIALSYFYPQVQPVVLVLAWLMITVAVLCAACMVVAFLALPDNAKVFDSAKKVAEKHKKIGYMRFVRLIITVCAFAYVGMAVTGVFWFFAGIIVHAPGFMAKIITDDK